MLGKRFYNQTLLLTIFLLFFSVTDAATDIMDPMETLRGPIKGVMAIMRDSKYANTEDAAVKEEQKKRLSDLTRKIFDYTEMSKRTLARNWLKFSPEERKRFVGEFTLLLENTYTQRMQGEYTDQKVFFSSQERLKETKARVRTMVRGTNFEIPVDYSMIKKNDAWKIYDVNIEGISLVKNYRTQFNKILAREPPEKLIRQLGEKNRKNSQE